MGRDHLLSIQDYHCFQIVTQNDVSLLILTFCNIATFENIDRQLFRKFKGQQHGYPVCANQSVIQRSADKDSTTAGRSQRQFFGPMVSRPGDRWCLYDSDSPSHQSRSTDRKSSSGYSETGRLHNGYTCRKVVSLQARRHCSQRVLRLAEKRIDFASESDSKFMKLYFLR